jgi:hypothetical protein
MEDLLTRLQQDEELLRLVAQDGVGPKPGPLRAQRSGALELARIRGLTAEQLIAELDLDAPFQAYDARRHAQGKTAA